MRFPLVSRRAYDEATAACEANAMRCITSYSRMDKLMARLRVAQEAATAERAEVKRLTDLLVEMKRDGFSAPQPPAAPAPPPEPLPAEVGQAMAYLTREGYSTDELGREESMARQMLARGMDAASVAQMIVEGDTRVTF